MEKSSGIFMHLPARLQLKWQTLEAITKTDFMESPIVGITHQYAIDQCLKHSLDLPIDSYKWLY